MTIWACVAAIRICATSELGEGQDKISNNSADEIQKGTKKKDQSVVMAQSKSRLYLYLKDVGRL